jgi:hypothetical protein
MSSSQICALLDLVSSSKRHKSRSLLLFLQMTLFIESETIQRAGCGILNSLHFCPNSPTADLIGHLAAMAAMTRFPTDVRIQFWGGNILLATPGCDPLHVALFGGPLAVSRAMRVCSTNQDFQFAGCKQLGALYQLAVKEGAKGAKELKTWGALFRKEVQRLGLGCGASLLALQGARKAFSAAKGLSNLAEWVAEERPKKAKSLPLEVERDLPKETVTEKRDWAAALSSLLGALEAFSKSARVQEAGLVELREWAMPGGPVSAPPRWPKEEAGGCKVGAAAQRASKRGLDEPPQSKEWTFGGFPQFPGQPCTDGKERPEAMESSHLLLTRALHAAVAAAESFPFDSECAYVAFSALNELLPLGFDITAYVQQLKLLGSKEGRTGGSGELTAGATCDKARSEKLDSQSAVSTPHSTSEREPLQEALFQAIKEIVCVFERAVGVVQKRLESGDENKAVRTGADQKNHEVPDSESVLCCTMAEFAAMPPAFCLAFEKLVGQALKISQEELEQRTSSNEVNASVTDVRSPRTSEDAEGASAEGKVTSTISLEESRVLQEGPGVRQKGPEVLQEGRARSPFGTDGRSKKACQSFSHVTEQAGLPAVLATALEAFGRLLLRRDVSRDAAIQAAKSMEHMYYVWENTDFSEGWRVTELYLEGGPGTPFGANWSVSGLRAIFVELIAYNRAIGKERLAGSESELSALEAAQAFAEALGAAFSVRQVRQGGAAALCEERGGLLEELVGILRGAFLRDGEEAPAFGDRLVQNGKQRTKTLYESALHKAVSPLFTECPEASAAAARVGGRLLVEDFLRACWQKKPVSACSLQNEVTNFKRCLRGRRCLQVQSFVANVPLRSVCFQ